MKYVHDGPYRALLDRIEAELAHVSELAGFEVAVRVMEIDDGRAARVATWQHRIEIDERRFEHAFDWMRHMHLVRETARAWRRHRGFRNSDHDREGYEADLMVLDWGLGEPHLKALASILGEDYVAVLGTATTEGREKAESRLAAWLHYREVLGGIVHHFRG